MYFLTGLPLKQFTPPHFTSQTRWSSQHATRSNRQAKMCEKMTLKCAACSFIDARWILRCLMYSVIGPGACDFCQTLVYFSDAQCQACRAGRVGMLGTSWV